MLDYLEKMLKSMRSAFSYETTFVWFILVFVGLMTRADSHGVSSIVRALGLAPSCYPCLIHVFHPSAWTARGLLDQWWKLLAKEGDAFMVEQRVVFLGDQQRERHNAL